MGVGLGSKPSRHGRSPLSSSRRGAFGRPCPSAARALDGVT